MLVHASVSRVNVWVQVCVFPPPDHTPRGSSPPFKSSHGKELSQLTWFPSACTAPPGSDQVPSGSAKCLALEGGPGCPHFTEGGN